MLFDVLLLFYYFSKSTGKKTFLTYCYLYLLQTVQVYKNRKENVFLNNWPGLSCSHRYIKFIEMDSIGILV